MFSNPMLVPRQPSPTSASSYASSTPGTGAIASAAPSPATSSVWVSASTALTTVPPDSRRSSWSHPIGRDGQLQNEHVPLENFDKHPILPSMLLQPIPPFKPRQQPQSAPRQHRLPSFEGLDPASDSRRSSESSEASSSNMSDVPLAVRRKRPVAVDTLEHPGTSPLSTLASAHERVGHESSKRTKYDHTQAHANSDPLSALTTAAVDALNSMPARTDTASPGQSPSMSNSQQSTLPAPPNVAALSAMLGRSVNGGRNSFDAAALTALKESQLEKFERFKDSQLEKLERRERAAEAVAAAAHANQPAPRSWLQNNELAEALDKLRQQQNGGNAVVADAPSSSSSASSITSAAVGGPNVVMNKAMGVPIVREKRRPAKDLKIATGPSPQAYFQAVNGPVTAGPSQSHYTHHDPDDGPSSSQRAPVVPRSAGPNTARRTQHQNSNPKGLPTVHSPVIPTPHTSSAHQQHYTMQQHQHQQAQQQRQQQYGAPTYRGEPVVPRSAAATATNSHFDTASPPMSMPMQGGMSASKASFLSLFSTFYDSLGDASVLTASLEAQINRSCQLMQVLQEARQSLIEMVDTKIDRAKGEWRRDMESVEKRLSRVEVMLGGRSEGDGLNDRLDRIERMVLGLSRLQQQSQTQTQESSQGQASPVQQ